MKESFALLIVDDNPSLAKTLADILDAKGFEV
jgi:DNA-binding response OmpR family regulator